MGTLIYVHLFIAVQLQGQPDSRRQMNKLFLNIFQYSDNHQRYKIRSLRKKLRKEQDASCKTVSQAVPGEEHFWRYIRSTAGNEITRPTFLNPSQNIKSVNCVLYSPWPIRRTCYRAKRLQNTKRPGWGKEDTAGFEVEQVEVAEEIVVVARDGSKQQSFYVEHWFQLRMEHCYSSNHWRAPT